MLYKWLLPVVYGALVFKLSVWCGAEGYLFSLRAAAAARLLVLEYLGTNINFIFVNGCFGKFSRKSSASFF